MFQQATILVSLPALKQPGTDGGKDGERAEKITLGYLEPRIREILGLLYPGYENVHMESNVHYRIPDEFVFSNNFKMFLK